MDFVYAPDPATEFFDKEYDASVFFCSIQDATSNSKKYKLIEPFVSLDQETVAVVRLWYREDMRSDPRQKNEPRRSRNPRLDRDDIVTDVIVAERLLGDVLARKMDDEKRVVCVVDPDKPGGLAIAMPDLEVLELEPERQHVVGPDPAQERSLVARHIGPGAAWKAGRDE